jgi:glutathione S-transferase
MDLIGGYLSPFVRRVGVTLHLYGMAFRQRPVSTLADQEAIRAVNPLGRVPALVLESGEVLIDSLMIIDWLDEQVGPARALVPREGDTRRQINRLTALAHGACEKYVAAFYECSRRPESHRWQPWLDRLESQVATGLSALEDAAEGPWLLGAALTHADIATAVGLLAMRADMPHLAPPGRYPRLEALANAAAALPAFAATDPGRAHDATPPANPKA